MKCTAQAARMMREAKSWRVALLRAQAVREQRNTETTTREAANQTENHALSLMADALAKVPPIPAAPAQPDPIAEAERYAQSHRKRALLIRRLGHLPDNLDCGAMRPQVVHAIVTGTTPILRALDQQSRRPLAEAA